MHKRLIPLVVAHARDEAPIDGRTRLHKMVFVVQQELLESGAVQSEHLYEFFPYDYGPFSKELADDIDRMLDDDLLTENEVVYDDEGSVKYFYELDEQGRHVLRQEQEREEIDVEQVIEIARDIKRRFNDELSLPEVIDHVYAEYPEFAEESVY